MKIELSPEEIGYLSGLLREPLEYYRSLAGYPKCTPVTRDRREFLETLNLKLNPPVVTSTRNGKRPRLNDSEPVCP